MVGLTIVVGGVVVVVVVPPTVASGADPTVPVPACSLATATATAPMATTALAPMTADNNLTLFCWSGFTLTTPFGSGWFATSATHPFEGAGAPFIRLLP